jgi:hypothetical protein
MVRAWWNMKKECDTLMLIKIFSLFTVMLMLVSCGTSYDSGNSGGFYGEEPVQVQAAQNDMQLLLDQAHAKVKSHYPGALFFTAVGTVAGGQGTQAGHVTGWRFLYDNNGGTVELVLENGVWGSPAPGQGGWVGDVKISSPLKRSLSDAIALMNNAGYSLPFSEVTLRWSLLPGVTEPSYIFRLPAIAGTCS